jgi:hypothetical protein
MHTESNFTQNAGHLQRQSIGWSVPAPVLKNIMVDPTKLRRDFVIRLPIYIEWRRLLLLFWSLY